MPNIKFNVAKVLQSLISVLDQSVSTSLLNSSYARILLIDLNFAQFLMYGRWWTRRLDLVWLSSVRTQMWMSGILLAKRYRHVIKLWCQASECFVFMVSISKTWCFTTMCDIWRVVDFQLSSGTCNWCVKLTKRKKLIFLWSFVCYVSCKWWFCWGGLETHWIFWETSPLKWKLTSSLWYMYLSFRINMAIVSRKEENLNICSIYTSSNYYTYQYTCTCSTICIISSVDLCRNTHKAC